MENNAAPDYPHIAGGKVVEGGTVVDEASLHYRDKVSIIACHPPKKAEESAGRIHTNLE